MAYSDWQSSVTSSGSKAQPMFICMSTTVDDLSYTPSEEEKYRDAVQIEATGRRSWKTIKGRGEAVWPPILEAALIEALEKYQPDVVGSRSNKAVGRFPMRNRFISDYIYELTGKRRTPKQVGSRLQQLRDTCKEEKILKLISHHPKRDSGSSQSEGSIGASLSPSPESREASLRSVTVHVDICLQKELWPAPLPSIHFISNDTTNPHRIHLSPSPRTPQGLYGQSSSVAISSFLRLLSGTVEFVSPCALILQSTFHVYRDNSETSVHSEVVPLQCVSSPMQRSGWLYSTELVPGFWDNIISSQDLNRFTILQTLKPIACSDSAAANDLDDLQRTGRSISVVYKFDFPEITRCKDPVPSTAHSTAYSSPISSSSAATPRQSTSNLAYCQWQPELGTPSGVIDPPDSPRYYVTSNTRGDLSSHSLEPSQSHEIVDPHSCYIPSQPTSTYTTSPAPGFSKYHTLDQYDSYASAGYYPPSQPNNWHNEQLTAQPYHAPQWGTNYC